MAENMFLRRQLGPYKERSAARRRPSPTTKLILVFLSRFFSWPNALMIVKPSTFIRWHRAGFRIHPLVSTAGSVAKRGEADLVG